MLRVRRKGRGEREVKGSKRVRAAERRLGYEVWRIEMRRREVNGQNRHRGRNSETTAMDESDRGRLV